MDNYSRVIFTIIAVCLLYVSFRLYTVSIFDFVPTSSEIVSLSEKDLDKIQTIAWFIKRGISNAGTVYVQVEGGEIEVSGGELDCNIVQ